MTYQIVKQKTYGTSVFYRGDETGALYVRMPNGRMLCIDANGTRQKVGFEYHQHQGGYTVVPAGDRLLIDVGQ